MKVGLEVHVELDTESKLFCACARKTPMVCHICLGHPGTRPQLQKKAVEYAIRVALALKSDVSKVLAFDRKTYFYPDLARGFQITQYEHPIGKGGFVETHLGKVEFAEMHLEEDPASIEHCTGGTKIDYSRSGSPLLEIVTLPTIKSAKHARVFLKELRKILLQLGVYDPETCRIRVDASVSIAPEYTRVEVKGITGFKDVERAIRFESVRQKTVLVQRETRFWDPSGVTKSARKKEDVHQYGYIPEFDIPLCEIPEEVVRKQGEKVGLLPQERAAKWAGLGVAEDDAVVIAADPILSQFFERISTECDLVEAAKWVRREVGSLDAFDVDHFTKYFPLVVEAAQKKQISARMVRQLVQTLAKGGPIEIHTFKEVSDADVTAILDTYPAQVKQYLDGETKVLHFFLGKVMRKMMGKADPQQAKDLIRLMLVSHEPVPLEVSKVRIR